jgi:hypothetical protein
MCPEAKLSFHLTLRASNSFQSGEKQDKKGSRHSAIIQEVQYDTK